MKWKTTPFWFFSKKKKKFKSGIQFSSFVLSSAENKWTPFPHVAAQLWTIYEGKSLPTYLDSDRKKVELKSGERVRLGRGAAGEVGAKVRGAAGEQTWNCKLIFLSPGLFRWGSEDGMQNMQIQYTNSVQMQYKWTVVSTWMLCMCVIFVVTNVRANRNSMSTIRLNTWELFIVVTNAISRQGGKHMWENTWECTILTEGLQLMYNLLGRV